MTLEAHTGGPTVTDVIAVADFRAALRRFLRTSERTKDCLNSRRKEGAILTEFTETGPDQREEIGFQRKLLGLAGWKFLLRALRCFGD